MRSRGRNALATIRKSPGSLVSLVDACQARFEGLAQHSRRSQVVMLLCDPHCLPPGGLRGLFVHSSLDRLHEHAQFRRSYSLTADTVAVLVSLGQPGDSLECVTLEIGHGPGTTLDLVLRPVRVGRPTKGDGFRMPLQMLQDAG